jgi:hypothetical protein
MNGTTTAGPPQISPVEFVKSLPPEAKQAVFLALLREALQYNGDCGLLPIDDESGKPFGYYVPPKAAAELFERNGPKLTEEEEREIDRRIESLDPTIPMEVVIADLKRQLDEQPQRRP